ncbi:hypothetical protein E3N88_00134 [Mikania micrantha]|uniref:Uncharacterized protein n=1 Tax=Mikania micrantha TaxID=192012 RepID=A0A5N6PZB5_9ASTR|nr:hypothetical protein E3N88_00134 [Mikania micrantha]
MEQTIYSQIVVPVVKFLRGNLTKHLGYVIFSSKYVKAMKEQLSVLKNTRDDVEKQKETNNMDNKEIPVGVSVWLNAVATFKNEVESISSEGYGCLNIKMRHKTGKKACEATEMIKRFTIEKNGFEWTNAPIPTGRVYSKPVTSTPASHGVNFKSRDRPFNEALKWLQQDNNKSQVIALCGMGGVDKTTMMEQLKMVANDKNMFDYIVPVVIGRTPNMYSIQNDIAIRLAGKGLVEETIPERADDLCKKFKEILEVKKSRILFILDDVWEKIELKEIGLTSPIPNGLKLLLTSRLSHICKQIAVSAHSVFEEVKVNVLEEDEARNLFFGITDVSKEDERYAIGYDFRRLCEDKRASYQKRFLVVKCGRLPLSINIIGTTLHSQSKSNWKTTLRRLKNNRIDDIVHEVIKISYEHIKHEEDKEVLLLCGLFPEDSNIRIEDLTRNAWGLNIFEGVSSLGDARDSTETCVGNLLNANLLINSHKHGCVKMHDLVLAFVLGVVSKSDRAWIIKHGDVTKLAGREESCKRISITCKGMSKFPQDFKYPNLSLLQLMNGDFSLKFPEDFYANMKNLQVIAYYKMKSPLMISRSLHCCANLKSLCLHESCKYILNDTLELDDLPNFTSIYHNLCALFNSQVKFAKLEKLMIRKMEKLKQIWGYEFGSSEEEEVNNISMLREIEVDGCDSLVNLFSTNLVRLLTHLERLQVERCGSTNVFTTTKFETRVVSKESREEGDVNIHVVAFPSNLYFHSLHHLSLSKCEGVEVVFEIDLNNQQPPLPNLQSLKIGEMDDMSQVWKCNNWNKYLLISYSSFQNITSIEIYKCERIKYLFSHLMAKPLSNLQKIKVDECRDMEEVVSNRDDDDKDDEKMSSTSTTTTFFPHLHSLTFVKLKNLKRIGGGGGQANATRTSVIHDQFKVSHDDDVVSWSLCQYSKDIFISSCNGLSSVIPSNAKGQMQKLEVLRVEDCESLTVIFETQYINDNSGDCESSANINEGSVGIDAISRQANINGTRLSNLKILEIRSCNRLVFVFTFSTLESLKNLETLMIRDCKEMKVIVEKANVEHRMDVVFPSLKFLTLQSLPNLEGFFLGMNDFKWPLLEMVMIADCPQMMNFTCGQSTTPVLKGIHTSLGKHSVESGLNFHQYQIKHHVGLIPSNPQS